MLLSMGSLGRGLMKGPSDAPESVLPMVFLHIIGYCFQTSAYCILLTVMVVASQEVVP